MAAWLAEVLLLMALGVAMATAGCNTPQNVHHDFSNVTITWTYNYQNRVCSAHRTGSGATEASTEIAEGETKSIGGVDNDCLQFVCRNSHLYLDTYKSSCATEAGCSKNFTQWDAECQEERSCFCRAGSNYRYPPPPGATGGMEGHLLVLLDNVCFPSNAAATFTPPYGFSGYPYYYDQVYPLHFDFHDMDPYHFDYHHVDPYHFDSHEGYPYTPFPFHNHHLLSYPFYYAFHAAPPFWLPVSHFHWGMEGPHWHPGNGGWVPWLPSAGGGFPWGMQQGDGKGPARPPSGHGPIITTIPDPKDCQEGKSFRVVKNGTCTTYLCTPGVTVYNFRTQPGGCFYNDTCLIEGDLVGYVSDCRSLKCHLDSETGNYTLVNVNIGCFYNDTCHIEGELAGDVSDCRSLKCRLDSETGNYTLVNVSTGCYVKGTCLREGHIDKMECKQYTCEKNASTGEFSYKVEYTGCLYKDACHKNGTVVQGIDECESMICRLDFETGYYTFANVRNESCALSDLICFLGGNLTACMDGDKCIDEKMVKNTGDCTQAICYTENPKTGYINHGAILVHYPEWTFRTIGCLGPTGCMNYGEEYVDKETGNSYRCDNVSGILGKKFASFYKGCTWSDGTPIVQGHSVLYDDQFYACTPEGLKQVSQNYTVLPEKKNWKTHCQDPDNSNMLRRLGELWNRRYHYPVVVCTCHPTTGTAVCSDNPKDVLYIHDED